MWGVKNERVNALTDKFYPQRPGFILSVKNMLLKHVKMVKILVAKMFLVLNIILQPKSIIQFHLGFFYYVEMQCTHMRKGLAPKSVEFGPFLNTLKTSSFIKNNIC